MIAELAEYLTRDYSTFDHSSRLELIVYPHYKLVQWPIFDYSKGYASIGKNYGVEVLNQRGQVMSRTNYGADYQQALTGYHLIAAQEILATAKDSRANMLKLAYRPDGKKVRKIWRKHWLRSFFENAGTLAELREYRRRGND